MADSETKQPRIQKPNNDNHTKFRLVGGPCGGATVRHYPTDRKTGEGWIPIPFPTGTYEPPLQQNWGEPKLVWVPN